MKKIFLIIIAILIAPSIANTSQNAWASQSNSQSGWVDIGLKTSIRLISDNNIQADGTRIIGIELKMPKKVKTYWRIPGETGIALSLDISSAKGNIEHEIIWAYPMRETKYGTHDFVYYGSIILPIKLSSSGNLDSETIQADIFMGICENICIPVNVSLEMNFKKNIFNISNRLRLAQAIEKAPIIWNEAETPIGNVVINEITGLLELEFDSKIIKPNSIILDNGDLSTLFSSPQENTQKGLVSFQLFDVEQAKGLVDKPIRITFLTKNGAYEVSKKIKKMQ